MNHFQEKQIQQLRSRGIGYRSIATTVGLSRDVVRNYCKKNGLAGYAKALTKNLKEKEGSGLICLYCAKEINQPKIGRPKKFCSDSCRREWWKEHPEALNRKETAIYKCECKYCKKEFLSYGNKNRKYCSHKCYIKDRFWEDK